VIVNLLAAATLGSVPPFAQAQIDVLTNRYDGARTGANLKEATLTPDNVNVNRFGKLYTYPVDGAVYAQPLYVSGLTINGTVRNVLYVATMNDKVYAFNADSSSQTPLWMRDFTNPSAGVTAVPMKDIIATSNNIFGNAGIESTPVIDRTTNTLYVVARTKENGAYIQRLHALDITTGASRAGSGVKITASVSSTASDAVGGVLTFDGKMHNQRPALALTNGVVLVAWAGHEDKPPYHGWIMGFDASTLARVGALAAVPDGNGGGIWQGGRAPTIDGNGNAYFATGNGKWDGTRNFGDSLLKFSVSRTGLTRLDYFTPGNEQILSQNDDDLSGSGFTLLPGNLLLGGGKEGVLYLLNANNLGRKVANDTQIPQRIQVNGGHVMGGPVFWTPSGEEPIIYNWSEDDNLLAYRLSGGKLTGPIAQGQVMSPGHPGGSLIVSAKGSTPGTGIVWASMPTNQDAIHILTGGILRAYDAENLTQVWTSEQNATRDRVGTLIKFVPPVVANGKVFMATHDNTVNVYGLLPVTGAGEVVLYAKTASPIKGNWHVVTDNTAAGGARDEQPNAGAAKVPTPLANPANYFELTFTAQANQPYRLWLRGRAEKDSYNNDSVYVQFSGSVTNTGTPINRIGTTEAAPVVIEDCGGCGVSGWGWQDNGYGAGVLGPLMYFTAGKQTIRVQGREDGISIDQIVLSPSKYLTSSPGLTKNDTTILPESKTGTVVRYAAEGTPHGNFGVAGDTTAAGGSRMNQPNAGVPKRTVPLANPVNYFELTFTAEANRAYRLWLRGRASSDSYNNDSVYVQFSGSVTSTGTAINRIGTTEAAAVVIEDCNGCGLSGWGWQDNGYGTGVLGPVMYFTAGTQTIRIQEREDGISIDQIVLSPDIYLNSSPGLTKKDTTILNKTP
jgi:hypothetical protein